MNTEFYDRSFDGLASDSQTERAARGKCTAGIAGWGGGGGLKTAGKHHYVRGVGAGGGGGGGSKTEGDSTGKMYGWGAWC